MQCRLIPLNKKFPLTPGISDYRPIIVESPLIKLLELRLSKKLHNYMNSFMFKGQTGFIRGQGTETNLYRLS